MRPSSERLEELRLALQAPGERRRKIARAYAAEIEAAGHPVAAGPSIDLAEAIMIRHRDRMMRILAIDGRLREGMADPGTVAAEMEEAVLATEADLRLMEGAAPHVEAAMAGVPERVRVLN